MEMNASTSQTRLPSTRLDHVLGEQGHSIVNRGVVNGEFIPVDVVAATLWC